MKNLRKSIVLFLMVLFTTSSIFANSINESLNNDSTFGGTDLLSKFWGSECVEVPFVEAYQCCYYVAWICVDSWQVY